MDANGLWHGLVNAEGSQRQKSSSPRIIIIGAGSRGNAYSRAVNDSTSAVVHAVADPIEFKRNQLGKRYIWEDGPPEKGQSFSDWKDFFVYEQDRRRRLENGDGDVELGVDAAFICTLDEQHAEIIIGLARLNLHILSEKPLATTLNDCLGIYLSVISRDVSGEPRSIFSIGHVLRYSPHNMLLRQLLLEDRAIGDVISVEHTEPVGWWHFSHSYVRGNWRREATTAPSLLTKSCHDIDLILWLLASPADPESNEAPHLPTRVSSSGRLNYFRRSRKPAAARDATNCLSCPIEESCKYSAKKIYAERHVRHGKTGWPVKIIDPEIEDCYKSGGARTAENRLLDRLREDYDNMTPDEVIKQRPWFGRCVWECDNDVCDDQTVTMDWDDVASTRAEPSDGVNSQDQRSTPPNLTHRYAKSATFHMIAHTEAQCERRGIVYGTEGEITYDSKTIKICFFATGETQTYHPKQMPGGHGGGDDGLVRQFVKAVDAVKNEGVPVMEAQKRHIGCTVEDVLRSHAMVFAAEEARRERRVIDWAEWWEQEVSARLRSSASDGARNIDKEWDVVTPQ